MVANCKGSLAFWLDGETITARNRWLLPLGAPAQTEPDWEGEPGDDQQDGKLAEVRVSCKG